MPSNTNRTTTTHAVASTTDRHKLEFNQFTAAHYACNGSGEISPRTIRRATETGALQAVKVGHKWLYSRAALDAWVTSLSTPPTGPLSGGAA